MLRGIIHPSAPDRYVGGSVEPAPRSSAKRGSEPRNEKLRNAYGSHLHPASSIKYPAPSLAGFHPASRSLQQQHLDGLAEILRHQAGDVDAGWEFYACLISAITEQCG